MPATRRLHAILSSQDGTPSDPDALSQDAFPRSAELIARLEFAAKDLELHPPAELSSGRIWPQDDCDVASEMGLVVLYFDESHVLTKEDTVVPAVTAASNVAGTSLTGGSATSRDRLPKTRYDILLSVLNDVKNRFVFGLFSSTFSHISSFAPPKALAPSSRQAESSYLQPPVTELPFDCSDVFPIERSLKLAEVSSVTFMAQFGRPLYVTLTQAHLMGLLTAQLYFAYVQVLDDDTRLSEQHSGRRHRC